jgi:hypothetical protein
MAILPRTPDALEALEQAICECHGDLLAACRTLGANFREACLWREADPEVAQRIHAAQLIGWATLENAAYQRAVHGTDRNVYYQGEVVGTEKVFSDSLLTQMLKARVPAYGEEAAAKSPVTVNVAVMPRAASYEDWVVQRQRMLSGDPASPVEPPVLDAAPAILPAAQQVVEQQTDKPRPPRVALQPEPDPERDPYADSRRVNGLPDL